MRSVDAKFQSLAFRYLRGQGKRLQARAKGIRTEDDIEHVHQARVTSRRLRTGLKVFAAVFPAKIIRRWNKHIQRFTKSLGEARDQDVQIAFLNAVLARHPANRPDALPGLERLRLRLVQQRQAAQPRVLKALDRLDTSGILPELLKKTAKRRTPRGKTRAKGGNAYLWKRAARDISRARDKLIRLEWCLQDAEAIEQHHEMRLTAKRLRDVMEIYKKPFDKQLNEAIKAIRSVQTVLGDIRDCDVWAEHIEAFIPEERQRTIDYFGHPQHVQSLCPGLEYLRNRQAIRRKEALAELGILWEDLRDDGLWERFQTILKNPRARVRRPPIDAMTVRKAEPAPETVDIPPSDVPGESEHNGEEPSRAAPQEAPNKPSRHAPTPVPATGDEEATISTAEDNVPAAPEPGPMPKAPPNGVTRPEGPANRTATCDCCGQNHFLRQDLSRIDSGQLLCSACLGAFRDKLGGT